MTPNCRTCVDLVLRHEGGFTKNPKDPGNWTGGAVGAGELKGTKYGIAASTHPDLDIENLTLEQAEAIYEQDYWPKVAGDQLPLPIAMAVLDAAVMSGTGGLHHKRAIAWLQEAIDVIDDGQLGPATIAAANHCDLRAAVIGICNRRLAFLQSLDTWDEFGGGWGSRVTDTQVHALAVIES
jgi:lysozyme family protein